MATYVTFSPSVLSPFQFEATLDGSQYSVVVTWNLFGQRFFINVYDTSNNLIFTSALVASPIDYPINLLAGYFTSTLVFFEQTNQFVVTP